MPTRLPMLRAKFITGRATHPAIDCPIMALLLGVENKAKSRHKAAMKLQLTGFRLYAYLNLKNNKAQGDNGAAHGLQ